MNTTLAVLTALFLQAGQTDSETAWKEALRSGSGFWSHNDLDISNKTDSKVASIKFDPTEQRIILYVASFNVKNRTRTGQCLYGLYTIVPLDDRIRIVCTFNRRTVATKYSDYQPKQYKDDPSFKTTQASLYIKKRPLTSLEKISVTSDSALQWWSGKKPVAFLKYIKSQPPPRTRTPTSPLITLQKDFWGNHTKKNNRWPRTTRTSPTDFRV